MDSEKSWTKTQRNTVVASDGDGIYDILATKIGAPAMFTEGPRAGKVYKWSKKGIRTLVGTGVDGRLASNHAAIFEDGSEDNKIYKIVSPAVENDGHIFIRAKVPDFIESKIQASASESESDLVHEVSVECVITDFDDEHMTLEGGYITGISFTMDGHKSRCTIDDGCGVIASELPSNIIEGTTMTDIDYKEKYDELKAEYDKLIEEQSVKASEEIETIRLEKAQLLEEKNTIVASFDALKDKYTSVIASIKKSKLDELRSIVGDEAAKAFEGEDITVCDIEKTLAVVASLKAKMAEESPEVITSGAPAEASAPATELDTEIVDAKKKLIKDVKDFRGV